MYRLLVVPLDGSRLAEEALPLALAIARRAGAALQLVHVHVPFELMSADSLTPAAPAREARALSEARAYLDGVVGRLAGTSTVPVSAVLLEETAVAEALHAHAVAAGADLVVTTTHGRGALTRVWLGSVADELVRRATIPTLVVRPGEATVGGPGAEPALRHLLIPLDGSALAEGVLGPAEALGRVMQAEYTLLRVVPPADAAAFGGLGDPAAPGTSSAPGHAEAAAREYLGRVAERMTGRGLTVRTRVAVGRQAAVAVLEEAKSCGADAVALETHGRRGVARLLLGSVADKVLRGATTPVLIHRPVET